MPSQRNHPPMELKEPVFSQLVVVFQLLSSPFSDPFSQPFLRPRATHAPLITLFNGGQAIPPCGLRPSHLSSPPPPKIAICHDCDSRQANPPSVDPTHPHTHTHTHPCPPPRLVPAVSCLCVACVAHTSTPTCTCSWCFDALTSGLSSDPSTSVSRTGIAAAFRLPHLSLAHLANNIQFPKRAGSVVNSVVSVPNWASPGVAVNVEAHAHPLPSPLCSPPPPKTHT